MENEKETAATIQARLEILYKGVISEENSVQYYETLVEKTSGESEEEVGRRRMYEELKSEELKHVEKFKSLISYWENELGQLAE